MNTKAEKEAAEAEAKAKAEADEAAKSKTTAAKTAEAPTMPPASEPRMGKTVVVPSEESREQGKRSAEVNTRIAREERQRAFGTAGGVRADEGHIDGINEDGTLIDDTAEGRHRANIGFREAIKNLSRRVDELARQVETVNTSLSDKADVAVVQEGRVQLANNGEERLASLERELADLASEVRKISGSSANAAETPKTGGAKAGKAG